MSHAEELPGWAALLTALLVLLGAGLTMTGAIGLVRFRSFYQRVHAPTLGTTLGTGCVVIGSMLFFSVLGARLAIHEVLIGVFMTMTTPVTLILLARAALFRDRAEGSPDVPELKAMADGEEAPPAA